MFAYKCLTSTLRALMSQFLYPPAMRKKNTSVVLEDIYPVNYIIYKATLKNTMFRLPFLPCLITGE